MSDFREHNQKYKTWRRQINVSLSPKYLRMVKALSDLNEESKSLTINIIVRAYFNSLPENERQRILLISEKKEKETNEYS